VRAEGAARQVMIGLIASTAANLVFDVLFILVLHRGVAGAALSMGLRNLGIVIYFAVWLRRHSEHLSLAPRWFTLSPAVLKPVFGVGVGELLQSAFLMVTSLMLNNLAAADDGGDRDGGDAGRPVRPDRAARQRLVRAGRHHLGADRHRGHRVPRRRRDVAGVPAGDRPRPRRGQPGARRRPAPAERRRRARAGGVQPGRSGLR
jgi:hypothetical protein